MNLPVTSICQYGYITAELYPTDLGVALLGVCGLIRFFLTLQSPCRSFSPYTDRIYGVRQNLCSQRMEGYIRLPEGNGDAAVRGICVPI